MTGLGPRVAGYDRVLVDLDGCLCAGDAALPGAVEAVAALRAAGVAVAFLGDDGPGAQEDVVRRLWALGFRAAAEEVVTPAAAVGHLLAETAAWRAAYVVGPPALHRHVAAAGVRVVNRLDVPAADVVVVCAHERFDYAELRGAVQSVAAGAALVCTGRDATVPGPDGPWPGTGAVVAAVERATGAQAIDAGKASGRPCRTALHRLGPGTALVVGDRLDVDVRGAWAAGLDAAVVLTGATGRAEAQRAAAAGEGRLLVADSLAALLLDR